MQIPQYTTGLVLKREVADTFNPGSIAGAGMDAKAVSQVADVGMEVAGQIKHTNDLTSVNAAIIQRKMQDLDLQEQSRKENQGDPIGYAKKIQPEYAKMDDTIAQSLPSAEAKAAYTKHAGELNVKNYEEDLHWENKRSTEMFANKADQSISDLETLAYRGTPLDQLKNDRQATTLSLGAVLAPDQIMKFDKNAEERITNSYMRGQIDSNPYQAKKLLDSKQYDSALGADKLNTLYDQTNSKIKALENQAAQAEEDQRRNFLKDPALWQINRGTSADDYQGLVSGQKLGGVTEGNLSVFPEDKAAFMVNQLQGSKNSEDVVSFFNNVEKTVGKENFKYALNDLKKAKLSDNFAMMALMDPTQNRSQMDAAIAMGSKDREDIVKKATSVPGNSVAKIEDAVSANFSNTADILASERPNGTAITAKMQKSMVDIATYYTAQGMPMEEAAKKASDWMVARIVPGKINHEQFRIPDTTSASDIEDALSNEISATKFSNNTFQNETLQKTARPVLTSDQSAYYLINKTGLPITDPDNKVVFYNVKDMLAKNKEKINAANKKAAEDTLKLDLRD